MGLVEEEWIDTLSTIDPEDIIFEDFVEVGNRLAAELKEEVHFYPFYLIAVYSLCNWNSVNVEIIMHVFQHNWSRKESIFCKGHRSVV